MSFSGYLICQLEGCSRKHYAKSFCRIHYNRFRNTGDPLGTRYNPWNKGSSRICRVKECHMISRSLIFCEKHYKEIRRIGAFYFWDKYDEEYKD